jgi:hypothetical protein
MAGGSDANLKVVRLSVPSPVVESAVLASGRRGAVYLLLPLPVGAGPRYCRVHTTCCGAGAGATGVGRVGRGVVDPGGGEACPDGSGTGDVADSGGGAGPAIGDGEDGAEGGIVIGERGSELVVLLPLISDVTFSRKWLNNVCCSFWIPSSFAGVWAG